MAKAGKFDMVGIENANSISLHFDTCFFQTTWDVEGLKQQQANVEERQGNWGIYEEVTIVFLKNGIEATDEPLSMAELK